jgi:hypothetical protein
VTDDKRKWLENYYTRISGELNLWTQRRDIVTGWALTLEFGTAAIYASFLSSSVPVAPFYRNLFLVIAVALSVRFYAFDVLMLAWMKKYAFLTREIERCMLASPVDFQRAENLVEKIGHGHYTTASPRELLIGQLRAGYLLILLIPTALLGYQLAISPQDCANLVLVILLLVYLGYEVGNFRTYPPLQKNPSMSIFARDPIQK